MQRETVEVGGNVGQLTIGQLPDGVSNASLTWVPVRLYTEAQGGVAGPSASPNEVRVVLLIRLLSSTIATGLSYVRLLPIELDISIIPSLAAGKFSSTTSSSTAKPCPNPLFPITLDTARSSIRCVRPLNSSLHLVNPSY